MSFLDHLWDDTVAGPKPEKGLSKIRKHPTFPSRSISDVKEPEGGKGRSYGGDSPAEGGGVKVTRSIMIIKPGGYQSGESAPASPAGSTPPLSPFSGINREPFRFRRRSTSDAFENEIKTKGQNRPSPSSPFDV